MAPRGTKVGAEATPAQLEATPSAPSLIDQHESSRKRADGKPTRSRRQVNRRDSDEQVDELYASTSRTS